MRGRGENQRRAERAGFHDERRSEASGVKFVGQLQAVREGKTRQQIGVGTKFDRGGNRGEVRGAARARHLPARARNQEAMDREAVVVESQRHRGGVEVDGHAADLVRHATESICPGIKQWYAEARAMIPIRG